MVPYIGPLNDESGGIALDGPFGGRAGWRKAPGA